MRDFCGPDNWIGRQLVPDTIFGRYVGECCKRHDADYAAGVDREASDRRFRLCLRCRAGVIVAYWYWAFVRVFGGLYHRGE